MIDMLAEGAAWLNEQLQQHASTPAVYWRGTSSVAVDLTRGKTEYETAADYGGVMTEFTDVTFSCAREELNLNGTIVNPEEGDRIVMKDGRRTLTYEVMRSDGNLREFKNDAHSKRVWIHAKLVIEQ